MAKSDLLKEAIADARAVKETALANAKIALQEAFAPRIQRMISDQIENELDSEDEVPMDPAMEPEMEDMGDKGEEGEEMGVNWVDNDISFEVGGQQYDAEVGNPMDEPAMEDEMGDLEDDMSDEDMPAEEAPAENPEEEYNEGYDVDEEDLNLEAIIRELEGDLSDKMEDSEMEEPEMEEPTMEGDHMLDEMEDDDMDIDEIIESILREEDMDVTGDVEADTEGDELAEAKAELEEAYSTVKQLKSIINEVNLLNAKLLYTNKLFRNFELTEGQKMKVIENFDRAGNTREVKLVFSTLAESFNRPTKKRVVKESYASKATATTAPKKETTQVLSEGFELANRWKKLAGLL
jgi:hypothetical protein